MLYREIMVVQCENYTNQINCLCVKVSQFLVLKMAIGALGTRFWRILEQREKSITGSALNKKCKKRIYTIIYYNK